MVARLQAHAYLAIMRYLTVLIFVIMSVRLTAQTAEQDSAGYDAVYAWVERKLTYNYFDAANQHWWVNRFQKNDNGSITIKNIAAKYPDQVLEKIYHLRSFYLYDINPQAIRVIEMPESQGRFVKGRIVRLEGFENEKAVVTSRDGVQGSNVNFVHISVPDFLEDSLQNYAFELRDKLRQLTFLDARLFNADDLNKNRQQLFEMLRGNFVSEDSTAYLTFEPMVNQLVRFVWKEGEAQMHGTIGTTKEGVYLFRASPNTHLLIPLEFDTDERDLVLTNSNHRVHVVGRNTVEFIIGDRRTRFYRY